MRTIRNLINQEKKVYILLRTRAMQYRFMSDADREGITFGDGKKATDRMAEDMVFPFRADINGLNYSIRFTPTRDLPSAISFKSGLYINGKRIMRRRL